MNQFSKYLNKVQANLLRLDAISNDLECALGLLYDANSIVCIGVGKSGFLAQKISSSLLSIGIQSKFLHPVDALHGDIGGVQQGAVVLVISKSGNSREINEILPLLLNRQCAIIAITNFHNSPLAQASKVILKTQVAEEGDSENVLPLISTEISLLLANFLVSELALKRKFSKNEFKKYHPGGQLGFNLNTSVADLANWKTRTPLVPGDCSMLDAIVIDSKHKAGLIAVVDSDKVLVGIVSDGDIRRAIGEGVELRKCRVCDIMNSSPLTIAVESSVGDALALMDQPAKRVFSAPVVDHRNSCVGVITLHDLLSK